MRAMAAPTRPGSDGLPATTRAKPPACMARNSAMTMVSATATISRLVGTSGASNAYPNRAATARVASADTQTAALAPNPPDAIATLNGRPIRRQVRVRCERRLRAQPCVDRREVRRRLAHQLIDRLDHEVRGLVLVDLIVGPENSLEVEIQPARPGADRAMRELAARGDHARAIGAHAGGRAHEPELDRVPVQAREHL